MSADHEPAAAAPPPAERSRSTRPPSMVDVARAAQVSQKTVSRVVNREPNVSPEVRSRVLEAIASLGFRPNSAARALVTNRTRTIGMVSIGSSLLGPASIVDGVEKAARGAGYSLTLVRTASGGADDIGAAMDALVAQGVEAIVISEPADSLQRIGHSVPGIPVLAVEHRENEDDDWILVGADTWGGARSATEHLLGLGHRTVWHVAGPDGWGTSENRVDGWRAALLESGCAVPDVVRGDWTASSGYEIGLSLATRDDLTAVFAANDDMAVGLVHAFERSGLSVPDDVSVVGFDDIGTAGFLHTPLTTVRQDFAEIARQGMRRLIAAVEGRHVGSRQASVPVQLIIRESTARANPRRRTLTGL